MQEHVESVTTSLTKTLLEGSLRLIWSSRKVQVRCCFGRFKVLLSGKSHCISKLIYIRATVMHARSAVETGSFHLLYNLEYGKMLHFSLRLWFFTMPCRSGRRSCLVRMWSRQSGCAHVLSGIRKTSRGRRASRAPISHPCTSSPFLQSIGMFRDLFSLDEL